MNLTRVKSYTAQGAIPKRSIVKFGTVDGTVTLAAASTDGMMGVAVSANDAADGDRIDVARSDIAEVIAGGNITRGDQLTSDANGHAVTAARHTHTENTAGAYAQNATTSVATVDRVIGIAEVSAVAGDIFDALIAPGSA